MNLFENRLTNIKYHSILTVVSWLKVAHLVSVHQVWNTFCEFDLNIIYCYRTTTKKNKETNYKDWVNRIRIVIDDYN